MGVKTDPVIIATSGKVPDGKYDGREIKREWLEGFVKNFNKSVYTPKIYSSHESRYGYLGTVDSIYLEECTEPMLEGQVHLYAVLCPNSAAINLNREGYFKFSSIEVGENFMGKGGFFLKAIALLNNPASAGVSEINFSEGKKTFINCYREVELKEDLKIFNEQQEAHENQKGEKMKAEDMQALGTTIAESIKGGFSALEEKLLNDLKPKSGDGENFSEINTALSELKGIVDSLKSDNEEFKTKFEALKQEPNGSTKIPEHNESEPLI